MLTIDLNLPIFPLLVSLFLAACQPGSDSKKERANLLKTDQEFSKYSVERGAAEAFNKYLADDALQLLPQLHPRQGRDQIFSAMSAAGNSYVLSWEPQDGDVASSGDLGFTWGLYTMTYTDENGNDKISRGKYLNVWRKDPADGWKVLIDMGNKNPEE